MLKLIKDYKTKDGLDISGLINENILITELINIKHEDFSTNLCKITIDKININFLCLLDLSIHSFINVS